MPKGLAKVRAAGNLKNVLEVVKHVYESLVFIENHLRDNLEKGFYQWYCLT